MSGAPRDLDARPDSEPSPRSRRRPLRWDGTLPRVYLGAGFAPILVEGDFDDAKASSPKRTPLPQIGDLRREIALALAASCHPLSGEAVRFLRRVLDWSQATLGTRLGYEDGQMIARWEKGHRTVPASAAILIRLIVRACFDPGASLARAWNDLENPPLETFRFAYRAGRWSLAVPPAAIRPGPGPMESSIIP